MINFGQPMDNISGVPFTAVQPISDHEFSQFKDLIYHKVGIDLSPSKKPMVTSRLQKRVAHYRLTTFGEYYRLVQSGQYPEELQILVDLLTTNETYFFREPEHFEFLKNRILPETAPNPIRIWSGASSSGEEIYTIAMVMAEGMRGREWEIIGSDVSQRMLKQAARGHYSFERTSGISTDLMRRYCLKGVRSNAGTFMVDEKLKGHVKFRHLNLKQTLPNMGSFDVIFLRNVLIYFDQETKEQIVLRVLEKLKPGGYFIISHTESLHGIRHNLKMIKPSVFKK
jgi:chemotaxis protein methyltransferase CheR